MSIKKLKIIFIIISNFLQLFNMFFAPPPSGKNKNRM
jgi:hypothetical protein